MGKIEHPAGIDDLVGSITAETGNLAIETGSITIEAALIVPVVMLAVSVLIYFIMIACCKAQLMGIASEAAQQGALIWCDSRKAYGNGAWDTGDEPDGLYYQVFSDALFNSRGIHEKLIQYGHSLKTASVSGDESDAVGRKLAKIKNAIKVELGQVLTFPGYTELDVRYENKLVQRSVTVEISRTISLPFTGTGMLSHIGPRFRITGTASSVVDEPAEFIRNVDFLIEYAGKLGEEFDLAEKVKKLKNIVFPVN